MKAPCNYEYRYSLVSQLPGYYAQGWRLAGYVGHHVNFSPCYFVVRPITGKVVMNKRKAHKTAIKRLRINEGLQWRG